MTEYILKYPGFSRDPGVCHVVVPDEGPLDSLLVGSLQDNPGTSVTNATEEIALALSELLFQGARSSAFTMFEYEPRGLPDLTPTFYRVVWRGVSDRFSMPTWDVVDPDQEPQLHSLRTKVREQDYTFDALTTERDLVLIESPELERRREASSERPKPRVVEPEEFRAHVAPTVSAIRAFTNALDDISAAHRLPTVDSSAMRELDAEHASREVSTWEHPVGDTLAFGALTLRAAADNVRSFAEALDADRPPIYAHLVLARAAFEASVVSEWLNEPGIAYEDRIRRGMCERLLSAKQVSELSLDDNADRGLSECLEQARSLGWTTDFDAHGRPSVDGTRRPTVAEAITRLLGRSAEASIGQLLWKRLTAVSEVSWWGLSWAIQHTSEPDAAGVVRADVGTWSAQVATQAFCIIETLRAAASARFELMGWSSDDHWRGAVGAITQQQRALLAEIAQAQKELS
jgi:hypothetical protein